MSGFESAFSLFGLLLGLSLAEILGGVARSVEAHRTLLLGWLTPLLGMLVILDVVSFWSSAWHLRDSIEFSAATLLAATAFAGSYYLAAYLVFPRAVGTANLDAHYFEVRRPVLGIVATAALIQFIHFASIVGWQQVGAANGAVLLIMEILLITNMFTQGSRVSFIVLTLTVAFYLVVILWI